MAQPRMDTLGKSLDPWVRRWRALPRTMHWAVYGLLTLGVYLGIADPIFIATNNAQAAADLAALQLREYDKQEESRAEALTRIAIGTSAFGGVAVPSKDPNLSSRVSDIIDRILNDRGVTEYNIQTQRGAALGRAVLPGLVKPDTEELQRVTFNVTLTSTTSAVLGVIAELERVPEITAISEAQLRRAEKGQDRISATLRPEIWVIVPKEAAR